MAVWKVQKFHQALLVHLMLAEYIEWNMTKTWKSLKKMYILNFKTFRVNVNSALVLIDMFHE